ncbi:MAG TPA: cobalt-precorrin-5B (C(1))-methyltransferase [Alphaproteobacteria bacterium]
MSNDTESPGTAPNGGKTGRQLRKGWTTGACAAAAARAAYEALLTGRFPDPVTIVLPRGQRPSFALAHRAIADGAATAGVIKDAGDDPDVTHGALILVTVSHGAPGSGIAFRAGEGVGTVTRAGLPLAVGEPAINPGPRAMIAQAIRDAAAQFGGSGDAVVTVSVPGGAALAEKTLNGRLGIVGGISILGTTGIVVPYSCAAWIHSIHRGIDVARAAGLDHVAAATGSTSEAAIKAMYALPDMALIDMGDFVGGTLKYLRNHPVPWLTIAGGFGKLAKLAAGHLDLHSSRSRVDPADLATVLEELGAAPHVVADARAAASAGDVLTLAAAARLDLAGAVARRARDVALAALAGGIALDVVVFDRQGRMLGRAGP